MKRTLTFVGKIVLVALLAQQSFDAIAMYDKLVMIAKAPNNENLYFYNDDDLGYSNYITADIAKKTLEHFSEKRKIQLAGPLHKMLQIDTSYKDVLEKILKEKSMTKLLMTRSSSKIVSEVIFELYKAATGNKNCRLIFAFSSRIRSTLSKSLERFKKIINHDDSLIIGGEITGNEKTTNEFISCWKNGGYPFAQKTHNRDCFYGPWIECNGEILTPGITASDIAKLDFMVRFKKYPNSPGLIEKAEKMYYKKLKHIVTNGMPEDLPMSQKNREFIDTIVHCHH